jgi:hypothetical protein
MTIDDNAQSIPVAAAPVTKQVVPASYTQDGIVLIGADHRPFQQQDCGSRFVDSKLVEHYNACFWLSVVRAQNSSERLDHLLNDTIDIAASRQDAQRILAPLAARVKASVAPLAGVCAAQLGKTIDFTQNISADTECCMAYAKLIGPLTVVSRVDSSLTAVYYHNPQMLIAGSQPHRYVYVMHDPVSLHYTALAEVKKSSSSSASGSGSGSVPGSGSGSSSGTGPGTSGSGSSSGTSGAGSSVPGPATGPATGSSSSSGPGSSDDSDTDVSDDFVLAIVNIAKRALPLHALAPTSHWPSEQISTWRDGLTAFSSRVAPALQQGGDAITRLVHDFLSLLADILIPCVEKSTEHNPNLRKLLDDLADDSNPLILADENSDDATRARQASKQLKWGRKGKALRSLLNPGVANEHKDRVRIMRAMHPPAAQPIVNRTTSVLVWLPAPLLLGVCLIR